eukprot:scaffold282330_cov33-Tisochrysis_lutea.AAC.2
MAQFLEGILIEDDATNRGCGDGWPQVLPRGACAPFCGAVVGNTNDVTGADRRVAFGAGSWNEFWRCDITHCGTLAHGGTKEIA